MITEQEIEIRVRYYETDAMGVLHHANYFAFFELGRTELLRANGLTYREMEASGTFVVVVDIGCRYRRPARYDDVLRLKTTVARVTAARWDTTPSLQAHRGQGLVNLVDSPVDSVDAHKVRLAAIHGLLEPLPRLLDEFARVGVPTESV